MKYLLMTVVLLCHFLYAFDDASIKADIDNSVTIDELIIQMQKVPRQYRHYYIDAIKKRSAINNQHKRETKIQELLEQQNSKLQEQDAISTLTGSGRRNSGTNNSGGSLGGGSGNSGSGNGNGGGNGGGNGSGSGGGGGHGNGGKK